MVKDNLPESGNFEMEKFRLSFEKVKGMLSRRDLLMSNNDLNTPFATLEPNVDVPWCS